MVCEFVRSVHVFPSLWSSSLNLSSGLTGPNSNNSLPLEQNGPALAYTFLRKIHVLLCRIEYNFFYIIFVLQL